MHWAGVVSVTLPRAHLCTVDHRGEADGTQGPVTVGVDEGRNVEVGWSGVLNTRKCRAGWAFKDDDDVAVGL